MLVEVTDDLPFKSAREQSQSFLTLASILISIFRNLHNFLPFSTEISPSGHGFFLLLSFLQFSLHFLCDDLLLSPLDVVGDVDEDAASLALHLDDDLGQSSLTNLLKGGQHTRAEHDLEGN